MKTVNFKQLSEWGLIHKINKDILHPLGLALFRNDDGSSNGCIVAEDLHFSYPPETNERNEDKFLEFHKNRERILNEIIRN